MGYFLEAPARLVFLGPRGPLLVTCTAGLSESLGERGPLILACTAGISASLGVQGDSKQTSQQGPAPLSPWSRAPWGRGKVWILEGQGRKGTLEQR